MNLHFYCHPKLSSFVSSRAPFIKLKPIHFNVHIDVTLNHKLFLMLGWHSNFQSYKKLFFIRNTIKIHLKISILFLFIYYYVIFLFCCCVIFGNNNDNRETRLFLCVSFATLHNKFQIKSITMLLRKKLRSLLCCCVMCPQRNSSTFASFSFFCFLLSLLSLLCRRKKAQNVFRVEL